MSNIHKIIKQAVNESGGDEITLEEVIEALKHKGFWILILVFILPNCVPVPTPPGYSTIFSIPIFILLWQMVRKYQYPHIPHFLQNRTIKKSTLLAMLDKIEPKMVWLEEHSKHRLTSIVGESHKQFLLLLCGIFAISIAIPLPLTNFIPGLGIFVISLGTLIRDGLFVIIGILIGIAGICFTSGMLYLGQKALFALFGM